MMMMMKHWFMRVALDVDFRWLMPTAATAAD